MPWLWEAMKDVVSCDKFREGANDLWSGNFRMGEPTWLKTKYRKCGANVGNWNILVPIGEENNCDSASSGERTRKSPNRWRFGVGGVVGLRYPRSIWTGTCLESQATEGESPVQVRIRLVAVSWVARSTRNSAWICRDHPVRLNTPQRPIVNQYREGKVKSTSSRRVK